MSKKTVIIGASSNPGRYAYMASQSLMASNHEIVPLSIHQGEVADTNFLSLPDKPKINNVDTITMYLNPKNQVEWEDYIISLRPKRIIFNPGTENLSLETKAHDQDIETLHACTLVMLSTGQY